MKRTHIIVACALALAIGPAIAFAANAVYRWVDKEGVVHFGDRAPAGVKATLVGVQPKTVPVDTPDGAPAEVTASDEQAQTEAPLSYAEQRRRERAESRAEAQEAARERQIVCAEAQARKAYLEPNPRVLVEDADGNTRRLEDEERLRLLNEANAYLDENCG